MALNQEGIAQLKADLRANAKHYNQNSFCKTTPDCGTECCMAGFCLMRKVSAATFNALVKALPVDGRRNADGLYERFTEDCVRAGCAQLGIVVAARRRNHPDALPPIFGSWKEWPFDLAAAYATADHNHAYADMAEVACAALDRIDEYGRFNKEAV